MNKQHLFIFFNFIFFYLTQISINAAPDSDNQEEKVFVTIFVHGIISLKPFLSIPNFFKFARDRIAYTRYARAVEIVRRDPFFYQQQVMQGLGLQQIDMNLVTPGATSTAYARMFQETGAAAGNCAKHLYYTFGWSGLLSPRMRYLEAEFFYNQLIETFRPYLEKKIPLYIRVACYSHGGNVALKVAPIFAQETDPVNQQLRIDELILVGVPVIHATEMFIHSPLFGSIYHFYSYGDRVQRMDCFAPKRLFSKRVFKERNGIPLPKKLVQIRVSIKRPHNSRYCIPTTDEERHCAVHNRRKLHSADPGHSELWSFGWIPSGFRKTFPLYPLPFTLFIPYVIEYLRRCMPCTTSAYAELHPAIGALRLYDYDTKQDIVAPFLSPEKIQELKDFAFTYKPLNFESDIYHARVLRAKAIAQEEWMTERHRRGFGKKRIHAMTQLCDDLAPHS